MATVGLDINRDGRTDYIYQGADQNCDGIPDALQQKKPVPVLLGNPQVHAGPHVKARVVHPAPPTTACRREPCDAAGIASVTCLVASICTAAIGMIYIVSKAFNANLEFGACSLFEPDCNRTWREVFSLRPRIIFSLWTPLLFGLLGVSVHFKPVQLSPFSELLLPTTYTHYAVFMVVSALFANAGYTGKCGVLMAGFSIIAAILCIIARLLGVVLIRIVGR